MHLAARAAALAGLAGLVSLVVASCSATTGNIGSDVSPPIIDGVARGLVLVHDADSADTRLAAYDVDGDLVVEYAGAADEFVWQPVWAPDGRSIAWTETVDGSNWDLVTVAADGGDRTSRPLPGRPDYITFDPTATKVLALTPSPVGFGLVIVDLVDERAEPFAVIDVGQPYFSDFSPDGERVIAHVGDDVRIVGLDRETDSIDASSGHQTPAWHPVDDVVFHASDDAEVNRLVRRPIDADPATLARFDSFLFFDVDPAGRRLAVSAVGPVPSGDDGSIAVRALRRRQAADALDPGLWIIDVEGAEPIQLDVQPTAAPSWDPTGERVLARSTLGNSGRWTVYRADGTTTSTDELAIDETVFAAYLPFWDQYVRSQTVWSPTGEHFVHVGRSADGQSGVWLHPADESGPSTFLADGDVAFFSPT